MKKKWSFLDTLGCHGAPHAAHWVTEYHKHVLFFRFCNFRELQLPKCSIHFLVLVSSNSALANVGPYFSFVYAISNNRGFLSVCYLSAWDHISCILGLSELATDEQKNETGFCMCLPICIGASFFKLGFR